ncbi:MAG: hypothetical protein RIC55_20360 [Pirellulaceae bacterium]
MSTATEAPSSRRDQQVGAPAQRLRATMAAVRLSIRWFGTRKTLNADQKAQAADTFGAEGEFLSAGKKLLDTRHPAFKAVTSVKTRAVGFWKSLSLPYPEAGIRLVRQDAIDAFDRQMREFREELDEAVVALNRQYGALKSAAAQRLGSLFNESDYPATLDGLFALEWDFPSVEPPDYLQQLKPELYQQECQRVSARFEEAVQLAEQAFLDELGGLVAHLTERLTGETDGRPKIFRDSAVTNLLEFFERFQQLNISSNEQLDELVERARRIIQGREPQQLRDDEGLRRSVARQLTGVQSLLDDLLVERPRRNILRRPR